MRIVTKLPSFAGVAPGQTAIANLPVGLSYHRIQLSYAEGGVAANEAALTAGIDEVRVILDGDVIWQGSAAQLLALHKYYGKLFQTGILPLHFTRPWMRSTIGEDTLALGTSDVQTLTLEVDVNAGAIAPTLSAFAQQGVSTPLGRFIAIRRFAHTYGGAGGEFEISDWPRDRRYAAMAMHLTTAAISDVEVEANQRKIHQSDVGIRAANANNASRVPQSGYTHIDMMDTDRLADALPLGLQDFRARLTMTAGASFVTLFERIEQRTSA